MLHVICNILENLGQSFFISEFNSYQFTWQFEIDYIAFWIKSGRRMTWIARWFNVSWNAMWWNLILSYPEQDEFFVCVYSVLFLAHVLCKRSLLWVQTGVLFSLTSVNSRGNLLFMVFFIWCFIFVKDTC